MVMAWEHGYVGGQAQTIHLLGSVLLDEKGHSNTVEYLVCSFPENTVGLLEKYTGNDRFFQRELEVLNLTVSYPDAIDTAYEFRERQQVTNCDELVEE